MTRPAKSRLPLWISLALVASTLLVFWPLGGSDFINYDDPHYVTGNDFVRPGLTWAGIKHAFLKSHCSNWHPLTWMSHMLDCQLFGLNPGPHHLTNLAFHLANTLLLFLVLRKMTGATWRSGFVAGLFALHPLHVESVAWISERKDVLSTFFLMLTIWAYARYAQAQRLKFEVQSQRSKGGENVQRSMFFYFLALLFFGFGLISKPMLVTLPFVLLLLDFWPLNRIQTFRSIWPRLVLEKIPFLALAIVSSAITLWAQSREGSVQDLGEYPLSLRMANALVSYFSYLRKTFWPDDLAVFYPYPNSIPNWQIICAGLLLAGISFMAVKAARRFPYFPVGWFWFLGTLVPVIGLVQVGGQAMADRYSYISLIGVLIAVTWGAFDFFKRKRRQSRVPLTILATLVLIMCAVVTAAQTRHWKNHETLFNRTLAVTKENYLAHNNLSTDLILQGRHDEAKRHLLEAIRIKPDFYQSHFSLGTVLAMQGDYAQARARFIGAIEIWPGDAKAHYNLGNVLRALEKSDEAMEAYSTAIYLHADYPEAHSNLAFLFARQGNMQEAMAHYTEVVRLKGDDADAHYNLAMALANLQDATNAMRHYSLALQLRPEFPQAHFQIAQLFLARGNKEKAIEHLHAALRTKPDFTEAQQQLAALMTEGR